MARYVQYSISLVVNVEEALEDVMYFEEDEVITEENVLEYIEQERWDFLMDAASVGDWDISVRLIERE